MSKTLKESALLKKFILFLCLLYSALSMAQDAFEDQRCGTIEMHQQLMQDPEYAQQHMQKKMAVRDYLTEHLDDPYRSDCDEPIFIPVAVHYQGGIDINLPCAIEKAVDQVRILNEDFAGTNTDIDRWEELQPEIWPAIQNKESCVQFCLATLDHPEGYNLQQGDYAVTINQTTGGNLADWSGYLNLFVRDMANPLGFAPLGGTGNGDGATIGIAYFSSVSCGGWDVSNQYNLGRTATHEVGHYLLLEHPWYEGPNADEACDVDGDGIADTPITSQSTTGCPYDPNNIDNNEIITCTAPVLWPTYMEYVDDPCMFMFSAGQIDVMEAYVETNLQNLVDNAFNKCEDAVCIGFRAEVSTTKESCANGFDGVISIELEEGTPPFIYSIDNGINFQDNSIFGNLQENIYEILVRDFNNCEIEQVVVLEREIPPLAIVDLENAFCGDNSGRVQVEVDYPGIFEYSISGAPGWRDTSLFTGLVPGPYTISIRNAADCTNSIMLEIGDETDLRLIPRQIMPVNCPLIDNGRIWLETNTGIPPFLYTIDEEFTQNDGRFDNLGAGTYSVEVEDARGCRQEGSYTIGISYREIPQECPCEVFIPNAITPNGDGMNELLVVVPSCPITDYNMKIYDRWGGLVFETNSLAEKWNGGKSGYYVRDDIYFYRVMYRWGEERNESLEVQIKNGYVQVLR